jgi:hypothetical protein
VYQPTPSGSGTNSVSGTATYSAAAPKGLPLRAPHPLADAGGEVSARQEEVPMGRYGGLGGWVTMILSKGRSRV